MLLFIMKMERDLADQQAEIEFKNLVFANNPQLYKRMFIDQPQVDESQVEWVRPQSVEEVQQVLAELRDIGLNLEFDPDDDWTPREEPQEPTVGEVDAIDALAEQDE